MQGITAAPAVFDETSGLHVHPKDAEALGIKADLTPMERLSKAADDGVTPAGRMAVALTITRTRNDRVKSGTALASPIFAGVDNDLEPEHRAARQATRRKARKAQRTARKAHR